MGLNDNDVYIIHAKRSPIGKLGGALSQVRPDDLLSQLIKDFKEKLTFSIDDIDDVIVGCSNQAGEDNRNIARMSSLLAGLPYHIPGATLNRLCSSSLDALIDAYARITAGLGQCYLVGGVESMSRAPLVISKSASTWGRDHQMFDTTFGWRFPNPKMKERFELLSMGQTAEVLAKKYKISRKEQDQFALQSHQNAINAQQQGFFDEEILPIEVASKKTSWSVSQDEGPRQDTSLEKLAKLPAVFEKGGSVSAGNSSPMNDGAALLALANGPFIKKNKLTPLARFHSAAIVGLTPNEMGLGPALATQKLLKQKQLKVQDFDLIEINEAFSAQVLACTRELKIDPSQVNLWGGAIALGHPLGCSGARIATTALSQMKRDKKLRRVLLSMCVGVGQGVSVVLENS